MPRPRMSVRSQRNLGGPEEMVSFKNIFKHDSVEIDENFKGCFLENIPNLAEDCSVTTLSSVVGEEIEIAGETFQVDKTDTFEDIADLLTPKFFPGDFPLQLTSSGVSRVLLRQEFIERWNAQISSLGNLAVVRYPKRIILSAASGLGKSIDLYLAAVFARYCKIPVQYFGNTCAILKDPTNDSEVASRYLKTLLFMNADVLDNIQDGIVSGSPEYEFLKKIPLKKVIYFCLKKGDITLCRVIRETMMLLSPGNLLIVDEHNALWRKLSRKTRRWPSFFQLYSDIQELAMRFCGILIAGSQHHRFEDNLPSGYRECVRYLEPLSLEEYKKWIALEDYPSILKRHSPEVLELTGGVPRMIAEMVSLARQISTDDFDTLRNSFAKALYSEMESKHVKYVESLSSRRRYRFDEMLYELFLDHKVPGISIADGSYRDRGLLIVDNDLYLHFYNSIARDVLLKSFIERFASEEYLADLIKRFRQPKGE